MNEIVSVSIIIPSFERSHETGSLLSSLDQLEYAGQIELIVINDGGKDSAELQEVMSNFLASGTPNLICRLLILGQNNGPAVARNIAASRSSGKYLWFLDSDTTILDPFILSRMVTCLETNSEIGATGGEAVMLAGDLAKVGIRHRLNLVERMHYFSNDEHFNFKPSTIPSNNLFLSRRDFSAAGGFLPWLTMYEDADLCMRLASRGRLLLIREDTFMLHHHSVSARDCGAFKYFHDAWSYVLALHQNRVKLLFLHYPARLIVLPVLDAIIMLSEIFQHLKGCRTLPNDFLKQKNPCAAVGYCKFLILNAAAILCAWIFAAQLLARSVRISRRRCVAAVLAGREVSEDVEIREDIL